MGRRRVPTKRIKHDEFVSTVSRLVLYVEERPKRVALIILLLFASLFGTLGARSYLRLRGERASFLLGKALDLYHESAPGSPVPGPDPRNLSEALETLREVFERYPFSRAARIARFYSGLCLLELGKTEEAFTSLMEYLDRHPQAFHAPQARLILAKLAHERGELDRARLLFQEAAAEDSPGLPQAEALLEMGRFLETAGRKEEALEVYDRIQQEFPESEFRFLAQQRSEALSG